MIPVCGIFTGLSNRKVPSHMAAVAETSGPALRNIAGVSSVTLRAYTALTA